MSLVKLVEVWYRYPGSNNYALKNINIELNRSKIYLVTGPNGAGKTTLLLVMAGLLKPTRGSVYFNNELIHKQVPSVRRYIGLLFQNPETMLFNPTVYDEIAYALRQIHRDHKIIDNIINNVFTELEIDRGLLEKPTHMLSYGEKKLVALASIIAYNPTLLLLDEPYTNLSKKYIDKINELITRYREEGRTIVIVSHDTTYCRFIVDQTFYMDSGKIINTI